jgi:hypothetical protein
MVWVGIESVGEFGLFWSSRGCGFDSTQTCYSYRSLFGGLEGTDLNLGTGGWDFDTGSQTRIETWDVSLYKGKCRPDGSIKSGGCTCSSMDIC